MHNPNSASGGAGAAQTTPAPRWRTPRPTRRELLIVLAILVLAALLRAYHLGYKSMWLDELNYARSAFGNGTLFGPFGLSILDHPPAYLFITRLVMFIGRDDWLMRLVPLVSSVAAVAALWALARTMFGALTGLLAAFVLAITPMHITYAQEAHSYGVYGLLSILTILYLYRAAQAESDPAPAPATDEPGPQDGSAQPAPKARRRLRAGPWRDWLPFVFLATLNMYVHYYSFYVAGLSLLLFPLFLLDWSNDRISSLWRNPARRRSLLHLAGALALLALLYLPQAIVGVRNSLTYATNLDTTFEGTLAQAIQWAARAVTIPWQRDPVSGVAVALVIAAGIGWLLWRRRLLALAVLLLVILPLPPSVFMAFRTGIAFNARRVIFILPVVVIVIAVGMMAYARLAGWLWDKRARRSGAPVQDGTGGGIPDSSRAVAVAALVLALIAGVASIKPLATYYTQAKQDWKGVARILAAQVEPGDVVAAPLRSARNVTWYYRPVRTLDNPRPALEAVCQQGQTTYFVVGLQERLPDELLAWLGNNFVEVPLKDVRIFYRQCGRLASDWYGAGAGPLFRLAINPDLPFAPTQRAYRAYTQAAAAALPASSGAPAAEAPAASDAISSTVDLSPDATAGLSEERDFDAAEAAQADAAAGEAQAAGAASPEVAATPAPTGAPVGDPASAQETAVALALTRLAGNATPAPGGATGLAEAEALLDAGQVQEALAILQTLVAAAPDDRAARMSLARALAADGQTEAALDEFESISRQWPDYPWALVRRGEMLEQTGDRRAAIRDFRAAVEIDPGDADVRFALAYALARDGQRSAAIKEFEAGLELDPDRDGVRAALERLRQQQ